MSNQETEREQLEALTAIQLNDMLTSKKELYCINCFEFLCPPIMLGKKGNICGSCWKKDSDEYIPNIALEKMLEDFSILCRHSKNGCKVRKDYKKMSKHSKECVYRSFCCPMNSPDTCVWSGYNNKFVDHFKELHPQNISKAQVNSVSFNVDIEKEAKQIQLMKLPSGNFVSVISADLINQELSIAIFFVNDSKFKTNSYQFVVEQYYSESASICHTPHEIMNINNHNEDYNDALYINTDLMKKFSTDSSYKFTLKITPYCNYKTLNEDLLKRFKCRSCNNYIRPPTYQCKCKLTQTPCRHCYSEGGNLKKSILDNIVSSIYFPCSYSNLGCTQIFLTSHITEHEEQCGFRPYSCPLKCKWTGLLTDLTSHLKVAHMDSIYIGNQNKLKVSAYEFHRTYCLIAYRNIFMISYQKIRYDQNVKWTVQLIGPGSECKSYSYEIIFSDAKYPHKKLIAADLCQEYTTSEKIFLSDNSIQLNASLGIKEVTIISVKVHSKI